ncbi:MAG: hypothetical protein AAFV86_06885 [Pseudomonadota bacterium]
MTPFAGPRRVAATLALALAALTVAMAGPAAACPFLPGEHQQLGAPATSLDKLPEGITKGWVHCPGEAPRPLLVWTMAIDPAASWVGVRDAPLFLPLPENPLVGVAVAGLSGDARFDVFMRREAVTLAGAAPAEGPDTRPPHRVFGTLCARAAPDRLDCSIGEAGEARRLKARVDLMDSDADGVLDLARHEVSILDGDRLQVLRFAVDHQPDTLDVIARWVEVVAIAGLD